MDRLIDKLMGVVMENTGATKCLLILQGKGGDRFVRARAVIDTSGMVSFNIPWYIELDFLCSLLI